MRFERVALAGIGYELPPKSLSSAAIEDRLRPVYQRLGLVPGRLELMSGIVERRFWPEPVMPSEVAARAGARALERAQLPKESIGCLIHASVCRDFLEPATSNVVHHSLGLPERCLVFDVSNACLGVLNGVLIVAELIEAGRIEAGLVVAGENGKPLVDSTIESLLARGDLTRKNIKHSFASLTIGSGAAAVVVARADLAPGGHRLRGAVARAATQHHHLCRGGALGSADTGVSAESALDMSTDSEALLAAGVDLARGTWAALLEELGWSAETAARLITHQVGRAHHKSLLGALSLPEEKAFVSYDRLGNVGSVALPLTLALADEAGFLRRGEEVALLGIGSGLNSIMAGLSW